MLLQRKLGVISCALSLVLMASAAAWAEKDKPRKVYYRYINESGNRVIQQSIPPEHAQKGYEVVTLTGDVIRVVPPAISSEEAERQRRAQEEAERLEAWDTELKRRYSSVRDVEAAKQRKLAELNGSIAILEGNARSIKLQITQQHSTAADHERQGREVPKAVMEAITGLEEELASTEDLLGARKKQYKQVSDKYDRDRDRFKVIRPN